MRIQRLEIHGFKSFADKVVLNFGEGISGIVGPNGCGKSNVVDALRWCMGEMSAKQLRGRAMNDIIFAGCDSRGPLGLAEVTITFNNDGNVPPQYAAYTEIAVTRRLHRDGTSEYLINKTPVRLRDITDLFLGTGVGTRAYSIIEQGRIGFIVSARPEDRRTIIEEVAGITKFKARKKAAERRMGATEQNLLRVNDIVSELERQLGSLRRQARKAERYKELKDEQRDLELHIATIELMRLCAVEKMQHGECKKLDVQLQDISSSLAAEETNLEADRTSLATEERRLQDEQEASAEVDARLAALERDLEHWKRQLAEATARSQQTEVDLGTAQDRIAQAASERCDFEDEVRGLKEQVEEDHGRLSTMASLTAELNSMVARAETELDELRKVALEHVHGAAQQRTLVVNLDRQRTDLSVRVEQTTHEHDELTRRRDVARVRRAEVASAREDTERQLSLWVEQLRSLREQLEQTSTELNVSEARILDLKGEIAERSSRLESLREIERRLEGYSDGVRALMGADAVPGGGNDVAGAAVDGIDGLVTDIFEVDSQYERAIEAALGDKLQYLIVDSQNAGMQAIEFLKNCTGGRSGFIPKELRTKAEQVQLPGAGVIGPALTCVKIDPAHRAVAEYLLGDVVVVEDLAKALAIWTESPGQHTLVTLDGEVVDPAGVLAGGSVGGAGLLAKRREARELEEKVQELKRQLLLQMSSHQQHEQARLQLDVNIQQLEKDVHSTELERAELGKDLEALQSDISEFDERIEVIGYEIEQLGEELGTIDGDQKRAKGAAEEAEERQRDVESQIAAKQSLLRQHAEEAQRRAKDLTDLKVQLATREEKLAATRKAIERLRFDETDLRNRIERGVGSITEDKSLVGELQGRIERGHAEAGEMAHAAQTRRQSLSAARSDYEAKRLHMDEIDRGMRTRRQQVDHVKDAAMQVRMDIQRLEMERDRLIEHVAERHDVSLLRVVGDYHMRGMPGAEQDERLEQIDRSLKAIGPINLTAIEECEQIETRYDFLVRQRDDLQAALDSLKRAIIRINKASRDRFAEAFRAVNEMFQKVFPRLFRGGEARLELTDEENLLESGVEIVSQPPGKKLQSVSLLSGGEKALTATALVFAIFLIKPSPFCVLDEVDAPLDDANVNRFNEMLRDISKISQFIVITHNKLTMAESDRLYGITMEEPGLSKVVSVNLGSKVVVAAA
ncbi:MAG: chromosome segregation protein SMC [Deltaproteobacteria bacterium RIFOXYA12_FULL_58_15]|nr:MAG: chromosome segregation protein SMC [Deltaproteobacteria bacterium RIFOXYA12_FULL_58_15]